MKMTQYEVMEHNVNTLVEAGQAASAGIREMLFMEAQRIREDMDNMSIEEASVLVYNQ
jgi:hypothetical protein